MAYYKPIGRLQSFKAYCIKNGFNLLSDDYRFIDEKLHSFDSSDFKVILERYLKKWGDTLTHHENAPSAENLARRTANLWLMEYADLMKKEKRGY